jgi:hypothetical protein
MGVTATASPLGAAESMMSIAQTEAFAAGLVLQPAIMISFQFKLSTGKAANLDKAGKAWRDVADQLQQLGQDLQQAVARIPQDAWSGDDRTAYERKIQEFCSQLQVMYAFCLAVGIALTVYAYALFVYAVFAVGMGTFLGVLATAAAAALASVVGAPAYPELEAIAATCLTITTAATAILAAAASMAAVAFQGGAITAAVVEHSRGNEAALTDLKQAETVGAGTALANLTQNAANAGLAYANRSGGITVPGGGKGTPLGSVDIDADRDKDHTWNVGGSATVNTGRVYDGSKTVTAGGHVRIGDQGLQGVEGEAGAQQGPYSGNVKGGWQRDAQGEDTVYVNESGGYSHPSSGAGVKEEGEVRVDVDDGPPRFDSGKINVGPTYKGGELGRGTAEDPAGP